MRKGNELEIVRHDTMRQLEIFLVNLSSRAPHGHSDLEIGILLDGGMTLFLDQQPYELKKGDIYIINRFQIHSFLSSAGANQILAFQIRPDFYKNINPGLEALHFENNIIHSGHLHRLLTEKLLACAHAYFAETLSSQLQCSSHLLTAMALLLKNSDYSLASIQESTSSQNNSLRLNRILDYIAEHFSERISLAQLANMEHITVTHASHFIKDVLGLSFQQYLNQVRFEHALALFETTSLSATDVCLEVGFSSTRYLNQMFQANFQCSYKEYLRAEKKNRLKIKVPPTGNVQVKLPFQQGRHLINRIVHDSPSSDNSV